MFFFLRTRNFVNFKSRISPLLAERYPSTFLKGTSNYTYDTLVSMLNLCSKSNIRQNTVFYMIFGFRSELLTNILTQRSDRTRKDVLNDTVPDVNQEDLEESTKTKEKSKKRGEKEEEPKKETLTKPKTERQSRTRNDTTLKIDNVANIHARSKSSTRKVKSKRDKSPSGKKEMEWDGKKWKVKGEKEKRRGSLYDAGSDKSEMSFMDSKHQDILMNKLMG